MFFEQFMLLCKKNNEKPTPLLKSLGLSAGNIKRWENGATVNSDILLLLSEHFKVSTDYLLTGEEKSSSLTNDERELLSYYKKLPEREKMKLIGRAAALSEMYEEQHQSENFSENPNIYTAIIAARSTNNAPPRIETGDFSDILNAPDSTDDYR